MQITSHRAPDPVNRYGTMAATRSKEDVVTRIGSRFCDLVGVTAPIVQAPIGGPCTAELAAEVSTAGALGTLALSWSEPDEIVATLARVRSRTDRPVAVNLVLKWPQQERLAVCLDHGVRIISTFWGDPAPLSRQIHRAGALHLHTVGSAREAREAVEAGVDIVVAQGSEAGGHVWGDVATLPLVPAVVDAVRPVPVVAAGGIADGRGLAAVLALGADAAWIGTRFLLAEEAATAGDYRRRVSEAHETDTRRGIVFDVGWPDASHRALFNSTWRRWQEAGEPAPGGRPGEGQLLGHHGDGRPISRYADVAPTRDVSGDIEAMAMYAGQGVALARRVQRAADIVAEIRDDAVRALTAAADVLPIVRADDDPHR